ncbi:MAG: TolC family protein [Planctomycetota bacterium]|nr:TolC family protein [Planctomycetota bacterium]
MLAVCLAGCSHTNPRETIGNNTSDVDAIMHDVDSGVQQVTYDQSFDEPVTIKAVVEDDGTNDGNPVDDYYDVSLDKVIELAMTNSTVLRDLGATLLRTPQLISTRYQKALMETNPQFGIEAALSAYDAQLSAKANFQNNDRIINNRFYGGGTSLFAQDRHDYVAQISKRGATGAEFALRGITDYDSNNAPANLFGSAWQTQVEGELRQPLLQGGGLTFNRIAGPGATPGVYNGVLVAKVTNDINATEFERQMQSYVSEVENAYWDLYFAYRDLDAKQQALENARSTWEKASKRGTSADRPEEEPLTREQYFRFQSELQDAISGKLGQRTQNYNGVTGGSIRGFNGVQVAERRLRLLIGESVNSRTLLRPTTVPESAPFVWDWNAISCEALQRRPELRNQRLIIKRRQMELLASKNFLSPKLDAIGRYRVRGLGQDLMGGGTDVIAPNRTLGSAVDELGNFNHQEWELGVEFSMPLGFRKAHMAVQNAELQVARDLAVLHEQERQIIHDLSNAKAETERALEQREINLNRWLAAKDAVNTLTNRVEIDVNFEVLLDAQRRLLEAQTAYHLSAVEYEIAEKNVHLEKGSLLNQHNVQVDSPLNDAQVVMPLDTLWLPPAVGTSGAAAGNEQAARVKPKRDVIQVSGESAGFPARK